MLKPPRPGSLPQNVAETAASLKSVVNLADYSDSAD